MADYVVMPESDYKDICDSVRRKTGKTSNLKSGEVSPEIDALNLGDGGFVTGETNSTFTATYGSGSVRYATVTLCTGLAFEPDFFTVKITGASNTLDLAYDKIANKTYYIRANSEIIGSNYASNQMICLDVRLIGTGSLPKWIGANNKSGSYPYNDPLFSYKNGTLSLSFSLMIGAENDGDSFDLTFDWTVGKRQ